MFHLFNTKHAHKMSRPLTDVIPARYDKLIYHHNKNLNAITIHSWNCSQMPHLSFVKRHQASEVRICSCLNYISLLFAHYFISFYFLNKQIYPHTHTLCTLYTVRHYITIFFNIMDYFVARDRNISNRFVCSFHCAIKRNIRVHSVE